LQVFFKASRSGKQKVHIYISKRLD